MTVAMDRSKLLAWLLVVAFIVCSCAAPAVRASRPLAASDGDARDDEAWVAAGAVAAAGVGGGASGGGRSRRSLGFRSPWSPPAPLWNNPTTMPVPPPPWA